MPTFRQLPNYADGSPGTSDRLLFETSGNLPRGVAPTAFATAAQGTLAGTALQSVAGDTAPALGGTLDGNGNSIIDYLQPHVSAVSGTLTQAAHGGRPCLITGTVTVPVTNGFVSLLRNKSGATRTVQPASGVLIHEGTTKASISLPNNRSLLVHGDGTDVWAEGAIA
jgi:hypothetical protein